MKCPKCGSINGKANKFCRECGFRLESVQEKEADRQNFTAQSDEVELGEELFAAMEVYESGDYNAALEKCNGIIAKNPGSASAHSLLASIYERKADAETSNGDAEQARECLELALKHREKIVDLNPDSTADRHKLIALRLKLNGETPAIEEKENLLARLKNLKYLPAPVLAAAGTFLGIIILLVVWVAITAPRENKPVIMAQANNQVNDNSDRSHVMVTPSVPSAPAAAPSTLTFPPTPAVTNTDNARHAVSSSAKPEDLKPIKIPSLGPELTITPEPKKNNEKPRVKATELPKLPEISVSGKENKPSNASAQSASGATILRQAIELHNDGRNQEAIGAANQAIALYEADIDAGKNVESAKLGVSNARKLISVWQQSIQE